MEQFKEYLLDTSLHHSTVSTHIRNLGKYTNDLHDTEKAIISHVKDTYDKGSPRKGILISILKYRGFYELPVTLLREYLQVAHAEALALQSIRTKELDYPLMDDMLTLLENYYKEKKYKEYCTLYLLLNYQTRNKDLVVRVTNDKKTMNKEDNYIYLRKNDCIYIRQDYKTASTYGVKKETIKNKKFNHAISSLTELLSGCNLTYEVKKITGGFTESTMMKLSVMNNNNLNALMQISHNRGTNINTMYASYNNT